MLLLRYEHVFSLEISIFEILANFDVIFVGEGVEIEKVGDKYGKREFQDLFKCKIRFFVALTVAEISIIKGTPLFTDF